MYRSQIKIVLCLISLIAVSMQQSPAQTYATHGMVVSDNATASSVGIEILKKGGNAVDASIATALALAVTYPQAGNIGGGGFMVLMRDGVASTIDFREKAPLATSAEMYLDESGRLISGSNHVGAKAIGVPGTVAGLYMAHQKYGKLSWTELVKPAEKLAKKGFPLTWNLYGQASAQQSRSSTTNFMRHYFYNDEEVLVKPGALWKQPELARTLKIIRARGADGFYKGEVAEEMAAFMKANGGLITQEDLAKYQAIERKPVTGTYKGYTIYSMPPPSSGGVALVEMLNMMEQVNMDTIEINSATHLHLLAEVMRRAYADRAEFLGDPDFNPDIPIDQLTSKSFAAKRMKNMNWTKASVSDSSRFGQLYDGTNTTHFSVIDERGDAVSVTYTLEASYGAQMGSPKLGFIFNNEMGDFNPQPGTTRNNGQIGTEPNVIQPEKRMLSSMTPTIVAKDGRPYLVIGSPGGRTIINTVFQTVLNVLEYDMPIDKAIESLKIHHQWLPDVLTYERDLLAPDTRKILEGMGHTMSPRNSLGVLMGILVEEGRYAAASDSSSADGGAVGY